MVGGRSRLGFEVGPGAGTKTVKHVVPVQTFLAAGIVDGEGNTSNRLVFRADGDTKFYFLFPKGAEEVMKPAAGWLQEQLEAQIEGLDAARAEIPQDPVKDLPADPLEV